MSGAIPSAPPTCLHGMEGTTLTSTFVRYAVRVCWMRGAIEQDGSSGSVSGWYS